VNQPTEECDGLDDAGCPGACESDCTCGAFCGDGAVNQPSEQCDAGDDAACPGLCQPGCVCAVCGDGATNRPEEECDGDDDVGCPGACQGDCTCGPFCGDGVINQPSEQCDGAATGACAGSCQGDCTCSPVCGNDVREGQEGCDGTDAAACPGECSPTCACPSIGTLEYSTITGTDLDTGWTGTSHDFTVQTNARLLGELSACDPTVDPECTFFANVGSYCSGDPTRDCTESTECPVGQSCVISVYGSPLPLSSGGVPVCIVNRFARDVTGTFNLSDGTGDLSVLLNSLVHLSTNVSQPCPICDCGEADPQNCDVGDPGTCSDNPLASCTVDGEGAFGPTSNDCPPNPATNISGSGLDILFDPLTTGTTTFPTNQACDGAGFTNQQCWCDGQTQPSACDSGCDGGTNDGAACSGAGDCPGGTCEPLCRQIVGQPVGEGFCVVGPIDQKCAQAAEVGCTTDTDCGILGPCVTDVRRCFIDPMVRIGTPGTTSNIGASTFCIPATSSPAVNNTAGLPGPGAVLLPNDLDPRYCGDGVVNRIAEECDGADDDNCPGACAASCTCTTVCGNDVVEFGEQCDGAASTACPGLCVASGQPNECTCPALCGDGFVGPGEICDPGGPGGTPPPSDTACPGQCLAGTCQCPPPICGNGVIEPGEVCEPPGTGCGPLQLCNGVPPCTQCVP
jgi:hypothetical protein